MTEERDQVPVAMCREPLAVAVAAALRVILVVQDMQKPAN